MKAAIPRACRAALVFAAGRGRETSTWVGLILLATVTALAAWSGLWRLGHAVGLGVGALLALLPDRHLGPIWPLLEAATDLPPLPPAAAAAPQKESTMSLFSTIESALASRTAEAAARLAAETIAGITAEAPLAGEARQVLTDAQAALGQSGFLPWVRLAAEAAETIHDLTTRLAAAEAAANPAKAPMPQTVAAT
jgi:hypothetical protein